jgi:hypothetical protein
MENKNIGVNKELTEKIIKLEFCLLTMLNMLETIPNVPKRTLMIIRDVLTEKGKKE